MINIQNIQVNKSKTFTIPIANKSHLKLNKNIEQIESEILSIKGTENLTVDNNSNLIINAKSLNFKYHSIFEILKSNNIEIELINETLPVIGMTCATCSNNVETTLNAIDGVVSANVNLIENSVYLSYFPSLVDIQFLKNELGKIGFELIIKKNSIEVDLNQNNIIQNKINDKNEFEILEEIEKNKLNKLKSKMFVAVLFSIPVAILGMFFHHHNLSNPLMLLLSLPVILYSGLDYYKNTIKNLKLGHLNMDTLVGVSTSFAFIYSLLVILFNDFLISYQFPTHTYFESAVVIIAFLLIGKFIEERAKVKTNTSVKKLLGLQSNKVNKIIDEKLDENIDNKINLTTSKEVSNSSNYIEIDINSIVIGDKLLVKVGDKIPVDGYIVKGETYIDESSMTGEPIAKLKTIKDKVIAGTINLSSTIYIIAEKIGTETLLSQIIISIRQAQASKAPIQRTVDKITSIFVPAVFLIAFTTLIVWLLFAFQNSQNNFLFNKYVIHSISSFITVLVISCPCALGLATPTAIVVGLGKATNIGILIKDAESLEIASKITDLMIDKTGTLTNGKPIVTNIIWNRNLEDFMSKDKLAELNLIYRLESESNHPLAKSIKSYITNHITHNIEKHGNAIDLYSNQNSKIEFERYFKEFELTNFQNLSGLGIQAKMIYENKYKQNSTSKIESMVGLGNLKFFESVQIEMGIKSELNHQTNRDLLEQYHKFSSQGKTCALLFSENLIKELGNNQIETKSLVITCLIVMEDTLRDTALDFVSTLKSINIETHILSGDNHSAVKNIAEKLQISNFKGNLLPLDKSQYISHIQAQGKISAMVGDGINDSTSLAKSDLSIAMGGGTDIAIDVAKVTILNNNLNSIPKLITLSKQTNNTIKQNLFWAFIYNLISIPVAAGLFINYGLEINPMIASFLMSISSISVVSNSIRLKYQKL